MAMSTGSATHPPVQLGPPACDANLAAFVTLLVAVINRRLEVEYRQQAEEAETAPARFDDEYDFVVVGGGTAGCVLAERLSRRPNVSVLLLERGGTEPPEARVPGYLPYILQANTVEYLKAVPEPGACSGAGCSLPSPFLLGGAASIGAMTYVRGHPDDFDRWAALTGDPAWNYSGVLRYFKRAERNLDAGIALDAAHHGVEGPVPVQRLRYRHETVRRLARVLRDAGLPLRQDVNDGATAAGEPGHAFLQATGRCGERWSTFRSYLQPALGRPNLRVLTYATATKVLFERRERGDALPRATAVEYRNAAGQVRAARALREVVLTAGALYTPRLLMLSGVGPADQLQPLNISVVADLPVGEGLQDHVRANGIEVACEPPLCDARWSRRRRDYQQYRRRRAGPLAATGALQLAALVDTEQQPQDAAPDLEVTFQSALEVNGSRCLHNEAWRFNRIKVLGTALRPRSRGSVRLNATHPEAAPVVRMGYFTDPQGRDLATTLRGLRLAVAMDAALNRTGMLLNRDPKVAPECGGLRYGSDEHLRCVARTTTATLWHWSATCRMGRDGDGGAVLDARLRVRGVLGLRVADASAMPVVTSGATLAPTIMLAERAADLVLQDHGLQQQQQQQHQ